MKRIMTLEEIEQEVGVDGYGGSHFSETGYPFAAFTYSMAYLAGRVLTLEEEHSLETDSVLIIDGWYITPPMVVEVEDEL